MNVCHREQLQDLRLAVLQSDVVDGQATLRLCQFAGAVPVCRWACVMALPQ